MIEKKYSFISIMNESMIIVSAVSLFVFLLLFSNKKKNASEKILQIYFLAAGLIFFCCYLGFAYGLELLQIPLLFVNQITAPVLLFYTLKLFFSGQKISRKFYLLFCPAAFSIISLSAGLLILPEVLYNQLLTQRPFAGFNFIQIINILEIVLLPAVILFIFFKFKLFTLQAKYYYSSLNDINSNWLKIFLLIEISSWTISFLVLIFTNSRLPEDLNIVKSSLSAVGVGSLFLSFIYVKKLIKIKNIDFDPIIKYQNSKLTKNEIEVIARRLNNVISKKELYLNNNLTIKDVSLALDIPSHHLSQVLNQSLNMNFYDFINSFRINCMIQLIKNGELQTKTILALAMDSGFNSKATFNRVFKNTMNMTPRDYLQNLNRK